MESRTLTKNHILQFKQYLLLQEKSDNTIQKYVRDVQSFYNYIKQDIITRNTIIVYKQILMERYAPRSVNSILASLNYFFHY